MEWVKSKTLRELHNARAEKFETEVRAGKARKLIVHGFGEHWFALARNQHRHIVWMMPQAYVATREEAQRVAEAWAATQ